MLILEFQGKKFCAEKKIQKKEKEIMSGRTIELTSFWCWQLTSKKNCAGRLIVYKDRGEVKAVACPECFIYIRTSEVEGIAKCIACTSVVNEQTPCAHGHCRKCSLACTKCPDVSDEENRHQNKCKCPECHLCEIPAPLSAPVLKSEPIPECEAKSKSEAKAETDKQCVCEKCGTSYSTPPFMQCPTCFVFSKMSAMPDEIFFSLAPKKAKEIRAAEKNLDEIKREFKTLRANVCPEFFRIDFEFNGNNCYVCSTKKVFNEVKEYIKNNYKFQSDREFKSDIDTFITKDIVYKADPEMIKASIRRFN